MGKLRQLYYKQGASLLYKKASLQGRLLNVNLSLSNACGAACIFCPEKRGLNGKTTIMPLESAKKIADELSEKKGNAVRNVRKVNVGENGDALLNPNFLEILRYFKLKNPNIRLSLFSNFQNFNQDISNVIVKEKLLDFVGLNIDGTPQTYQLVKTGIAYETLKNNFSGFLDTRRKYNASLPVQVFVLTYASYVHAVQDKVGKQPHNIKFIQADCLVDDFSAVRDQWVSFLNPSIDSLVQSKPILWAERGNIKPTDNFEDLKCPNLRRIKNEAFIAPNGDWYACCWDELQKNIFGNVIETSINEVYNSPERAKFIAKLSSKKFTEIGYPCNLVTTC